WKYATEVHFDPDPDLPMVAGLPGPLQQVLLIVVVNAAQAISAAGGGRGRIDISTAFDEQWVTILVADDGPGIPVEVRDRVFEPFFTTKPVGQGSGQGLSVARSIIVKRHGGLLTFASAPGRGTTFVIRLPRDGDDVRVPLDDDVIG
ncbi:MAG: hypothetical protein KC668_31225, partial [Myxococcales bacterium]|nr:hypothetical protein [Myxococcales bacterium]